MDALFARAARLFRVEFTEPPSVIGAGFVIGGYCPGTSIVALVGGKVDAALFLIGLVLGSLFFTLPTAVVVQGHPFAIVGLLALPAAWALRARPRLALLALFVSGCFYTDPINQRPSADIIPSTSGELYRGAMLELDASRVTGAASDSFGCQRAPFAN